MKTLAIRLEDDLHAQLGVLAQLSELTVTDAIRQAIEQWVESNRSAPELTERAQSVLDEIERDAAQRRQAIATLFGEPSDAVAKTTTGTEQESSRRTQRGKGGEPASS